MRRVAVYVDGFNLYHVIADMGRPHLKWVDLKALSNSLLRRGEALGKVTYFSAFATWLPEQHRRHQQYVAALKATGVEARMARFKEGQAKCRKCSATWVTHEEKETDVHFALSILEDAMDDVFDRAIIISADSDYVPVIEKVRKRFSQKEMFLAIPPKRYGRARDLISVSTGCVEITAGRLVKCLLPETVCDAATGTNIIRPPQYAPPDE